MVYQKVHVNIPGIGSIDEPKPPLRPLEFECSEQVRRYYDQVKGFLQNFQFGSSPDFCKTLQQLIHPDHLYAFDLVYEMAYNDRLRVWEVYEEHICYLMDHYPDTGKDFGYWKAFSQLVECLDEFVESEPFIFYETNIEPLFRHIEQDSNLEHLEHLIKYLALKFDLKDTFRYTIHETRKLFSTGFLNINTIVAVIAGRANNVVKCSLPAIYIKLTTKHQEKLKQPHMDSEEEEEEIRRKAEMITQIEESQAILMAKLQRSQEEFERSERERIQKEAEYQIKLQLQREREYQYYRAMKAQQQLYDLRVFQEQERIFHLQQDQIRLQRQSSKPDFNRYLRTKTSHNFLNKSRILKKN